jgi:hypothetical protein
MKTYKIRRAVAVYDMHYPLVHEPTWEAILDYLKQNPPDVFIFGGDQLDLQCISHHTKHQPLYRLRRGYRNDIEGFEKDILKPLLAILPKGCEKIWHIGNHEDWERQLIEEQPELEDIVNHVELLSLRQRGWKVIELGHSFKLGKLVTCHGEILSGYGAQAGMYPARKAVDMYGANVLAGHTHAPQMYTRISPVDHSQKLQAWIAPIAGRTNPTYMRNRPNAWVNGFVVADIFPNGQFNLYSINVIDSRCAFGGKVYGRKGV